MIKRAALFCGILLSAHAAAPDYQATTLAGTIPPPTNVALNQYLQGVGVVAYDSHGTLYYSAGSAIWRLNAGGTSTQIVASISQGIPAHAQVTIGGGATVAAMAFDAQGNLYVADGYDLVVRKVAPDFSISTFAGTGQFPQTGSNAGPGVTALQVPLLPSGIAIDAAGTIYVGDSGSQAIVAFSPDGQTTAVLAGNNPTGPVGDNGPAAQANVSPLSLAISGNLLFVVDPGSAEIRQIDLQTKIIAPVLNAQQSNAVLTGLTFDTGFAVAPDGLLYAQGNNAIYQVNPQTGAFQMAIGDGIYGDSGDGGLPNLARFEDPQGIAVDASGNIAIADGGANNIRVVGPSLSTVQKVAGLPHFAGDGGPAALALLDTPNCMAADASGNVYFADLNNDRVRKIASGGLISTVAGTGTVGFAGDFGPAVSAQLNLQSSVFGQIGSCLAVDQAGNLYIQDSGNGRVRRVDTLGNITTVAGGGSAAPANGVAATAAQIQLNAIAVDPSGDLFILQDAAILEVSSGEITVIAGDGTLNYAGENIPATKAELEAGPCMGTDAAGDLFFCDLSGRVREINTQGIIHTVAGNGQSPVFTAGIPAGVATGTAISQPLALAAGPQGQLYIHPGVSSQLVYVDTSGNLTPVAGVPGQIAASDSGDGGDANQASFSSFNSLAVDPAGDVYVADGSLYVRELRLIPASGPPPFIGAGGVIGAGGSLPAVITVSPNGLAAIFGANFSPSGATHTVGASDLVNGKVPTVLQGICASFAGTPAAIVGVYPSQLDVQVPTLPPGPVTVQVTFNCGEPNAVLSNYAGVVVAAASPEFFSFLPDPLAGHNPVSAVNPLTGAYTGPPGLLSGATFTPANPGGIVEAYGTGWGATTPPVGLGVLPGGQFPLALPYSVSLGGNTIPPANILYAGASPCCAGLYQIDFTVPSTAASGNQSLVITVGGVPSPSGAYLAIQ